MKKFALGSMCLFSFVLSTGVHAMEKSEYGFVCKKTFCDSVEKACANGNLDRVKYLVESTETPIHHFGDNGFPGVYPVSSEKANLLKKKEFMPKIYGLETSLAKKYMDVFRSMNNWKLFFDDAFFAAVEKGKIKVAEYLLTSDYTKHKISDWIKAKLILVRGIECGNLKIVDCMMDFEGRGLVKYNVKVLEVVSRGLENKCK